MRLKIVRDLRILERASKGETGMAIGKSYKLSQSSIENIVKVSIREILPEERIRYFSPMAAAREFKAQILERLEQKRQIINSIEQLQDQLDQKIKQLNLR